MAGAGAQARRARRWRTAGLAPWLAVAALLAAPAAAQESVGLPRADGLFDLQTLVAMAEQGDKRAAFLLGTRYASGRGGTRDDSEAVRWFRQAAESGLAEAQYNLGVMYARGRGVKADPAEAARWYGRAADQGLAEAQFNLGTLYGMGLGVERDEGRAAAWLERAAERGLARAQYNLAVLYEHGRGVRLDAQRAMHWYGRAVEQGFEPAGARLAALRQRMAVAGDAPAGGVAPGVSAGGGAATDAAVPPPASASPDSPAPAASLSTGPSTGPSAGSSAGSSSGPSAGPSSGPGGDGAAWIAALAPERYTVQLASFTDRDDAERLRKQVPTTAPAGIYASRRRGRHLYAVVMGDYASYREAEAAVAALPERLRRLEPWIRKVEQVQAVMEAPS